MKAKLTPWFSGDVKPARIGVYERAYGNAKRRFNFYDGHCWMFGGDSPAGADFYRSLESRAGPLPWRGLASDPSKGQP